MHRLPACLVLMLSFLPTMAGAQPFTLPDTGQSACFDDSRQIRCPAPGESFFGQDAQYLGNMPRYRDNGDGTISDLVTGLMWVKARGEMVTWDEAMQGGRSCTVGGHRDWRAPSIKELYSLIDFNGWMQGSEATSTPFIDTRYFDFQYGDTSTGARFIDCQDWSATEYRGLTMKRNPTVFGVNFADGRIKGYGKSSPRGTKRLYIRYVRGNPQYGKNDFRDNKDGTITDRATGLTWQQADSGRGLNWQEALAYCESLVLAGRDDWRLPNVKELQSIVDYTRSPTSTASAAIDPTFSVTAVESYYWSSTTHLDGPGSHAMRNAAYVAFGRAMGYMKGPRSGGTAEFMDVHGAGAQRSDPKSGDPADYPTGFGPQGDDRRIFNFARCVTGGSALRENPPYTPLSGSGTHNTRPAEEHQDHAKPQGQSRHGSHGPPPQAITACAGKSEGSSCSFHAPHGRVSGTCRTRHGSTACIPKRGQRGPMQ